MAAPISWTPGKMRFFCRKTAMSIKFLVLGGGGYLGFGGGGVPILFLWARGFFWFFIQEPRKGGFSKVRFFRVERHAKYWAQQYIWHSERHSQERPTLFSNSRTPLLLVPDLFLKMFRDGETTIKLKCSLLRGGGLGAGEENSPKTLVFVGNATTIKFWKCKFYGREFFCCHCAGS